jgi:prefoldin subunit 5
MNVQTNDNESFPIIPDFIVKSRKTVAGEQSGINAEEYESWQRDMEHRRQRSRDLSEKREELTKKKDINLLESLDAELEALELGAQDFEATHLKPNEPLISARSEVDRLRNELAAAESQLAAIEAKGSSVDRLYAAVTRAEGALNGLIGVAETEAMNKLIISKFGWLAPRHKVRRETLIELGLDIGVQKLKEFAIVLHRQRTEDISQLQQRMDAVGRQLAALRDHLEPETA